MMQRAARLVGIPDDASHDELAAAITRRPGHRVVRLGAGTDAGKCDVVVAIGDVQVVPHPDTRRYHLDGPVRGPDVAACRHQLLSGVPGIVAPLPISGVEAVRPEESTVSVLGSGDPTAVAIGVLTGRGVRVLPVGDPRAGVVVAVEPVDVLALRRSLAAGCAFVGMAEDPVVADTVAHRSDGLVCRAVNDAIDAAARLAVDRHERERLGLEASLVIRSASWSRVARALLVHRTGGRPRLPEGPAGRPRLGLATAMSDLAVGPGSVVSGKRYGADVEHRLEFASILRQAAVAAVLGGKGSVAARE